MTLVVHDWGSALGFDWARRHPERVRGIVYMEAIVRPVTWDEWPEPARKIFQALRSPAARRWCSRRTCSWSGSCPRSVLRGLTDGGDGRLSPAVPRAGRVAPPTLTWPRQIPIDGEPADVVAIVEAYAGWLAASAGAEALRQRRAGLILTGPQREFCRTWPNQHEVTVRGSHFIQEDSPHEIGDAVAAFVGRLPR